MPRPYPTVDQPPSAKHDRLLPWIAAERGFRALVLIALGLVLVTHPHADWASEVSAFARRLGLDPNGSGLRKVIGIVRKVKANEDVVLGVAALGYGLLEGLEAYGLWTRRRWGEWLTVIATALLLIPEVLELAKGASPLKVAGLLVNLLVVGYLVWRLRREPQTAR